MKHRYVFGLLAPRSSGAVRKEWNALIEEQEIDGFFDCYPTRNREDMELRLSEMFTLGRTAYILAPSLSACALSLLDGLDASVTEAGKPVDTIMNEKGMLFGYATKHLDAYKRLSLWIEKSTIDFYES